MEGKPLSGEEKEPRIGQILRGQAWVSLHGIFYANELHSIAEEIEKNCKDLVREDVDKRGSDD